MSAPRLTPAAESARRSHNAVSSLVEFYGKELADLAAENLVLQAKARAVDELREQLAGLTKRLGELEKIVEAYRAAERAAAEREEELRGL